MCNLFLMHFNFEVYFFLENDGLLCKLCLLKGIDKATLAWKMQVNKNYIWKHNRPDLELYWLIPAVDLTQAIQQLSLKINTYQIH